MTIRQQGGVFGRNPSFNNMRATTASVDALTVNGATSLRSNATISSLSGGTRLTIENPAASASNADIRFLASGTGDGIIGFNRAASSLFFNTGGSESARITFGGDLNLLKGNLVVTNGKGIDFSATSGTGTSELFDDYEEGTWTPAFGDWTTAPTVVYANYTKIGNQVTVTMYGYDGITNYSSIGGLPFAAASNAVGAGIINSASSYSIRAGCSVLASATALSGIEAGNLTGVYWQLCATYFA